MELYVDLCGASTSNGRIVQTKRCKKYPIISIIKNFAYINHKPQIVVIRSRAPIPTAPQTPMLNLFKKHVDQTTSWMDPACILTVGHSSLSTNRPQTKNPISWTLNWLLLSTWTNIRMDDIFQQTNRSSLRAYLKQKMIFSNGHTVDLLCAHLAISLRFRKCILQQRNQIYI
jgi:hypothetical protein